MTATPTTTSDWRGLARDLYESGGRTREIAEILGVTSSTVLRALHRAGVPIRPAGSESRTSKYTAIDSAERTHERKRAYGKARRECGLCVLCGAPVHGDRRLCTAHLAQERDRARRRLAECVERNRCRCCERAISRGTLCEDHRTRNGLVSRARRHHDPTQPPFIYFIQEGCDGAIKIGRCRCDPLVRLRELQIGNPAPLDLLAVIRDGSFTEDDLHKRFEHLRVRGEWFRPDVELYAFMLSLLERGSS